MKPRKKTAHKTKEDLSKCTDEQLHSCIMAWQVIDVKDLTGILAEIEKRKYLKEKEKCLCECEYCEISKPKSQIAGFICKDCMELE